MNTSLSTMIVPAGWRVTDGALLDPQAELCAATTMEEVEALLEEFGGIRVVPLLQQILFVTPIVGS